LVLRKVGTGKNIIKAYSAVLNKFKAVFFFAKNVTFYFTRYKNNFLIGIVGPQKKSPPFLIKSIRFFFKAVLYLEVLKVLFVRKKSVPFLRHLIRLKEFRVSFSSLSKNLTIVSNLKTNIDSKFFLGNKFLKQSKNAEFRVRILAQIKKFSEGPKLNIKKISKKIVLKQIIKGLKIRLRLENWSEIEGVVNYFSVKKKAVTIPSLKIKNNLGIAVLQNYFRNVLLWQWLMSCQKGKSQKLNTLKKFFFLAAQKIFCQKIPIFETSKKKEIVKKTYDKKAVNLTEKKEILSVIIALAKKKKHSDLAMAFKQLVVEAPLKYLFKSFRMLGYVHPIKKKACSNTHKVWLSTKDILKHYNTIIKSLNKSYAKVLNFRRLQGLIKFLQRSCVLTLAKKHNKTASWVYTNCIKKKVFF
jgi:hypothetical protein